LGLSTIAVSFSRFAVRAETVTPAGFLDPLHGVNDETDVVIRATNPLSSPAAYCVRFTGSTKQGG
jgi:hypothetical protein